MTEKFTLHRKTTHKYVTGWSHLDESEYVGTARPLVSKTRKEEWESYTEFHILLVNPDKEATREQVMEGIKDTMKFGCRCEHDCCGHFQGYIQRVRPLKGNLYGVILSAYRNV